MARDTKYRPVPYDPKAALKRDLRDPDFRAAWESIQDEFTALDVLLEARHRAGLTQEQVAARMGVSQPALARVETSLGSRKHSPSLATLRKYAVAVGCKLQIRLVHEK
ncbi:transcriptional regulator [Candidatus Methylomirabilis limnetica]|jgi:DNA-binding XRE family transcriptional regulator|uniref:Transcriptional regulator n=1 Tax=Candidatus Methylomirabilis limnetica TaxID=2033718 RepID=A0A2T4TV86_9BACT|nr:helix-turn-helix transcriptional regulator [Candidatus Methylomirabilis limnetica]PTL35026.1 transcriptional regulator [Candidatus Methylomirabilis limnetica]